MDTQKHLFLMPRRTTCVSDRIEVILHGLLASLHMHTDKGIIQVFKVDGSFA